MKKIPMSKDRCFQAKKEVRGRIFSRSHVGAALTVVLILCIVVTMLATVMVSAQTRASGPYKVILTTTNFSQSLQATAADLSDPARALFNVQNGTPFWYSISVQSTPAGIAPDPADPADLFTTTLYGASPLLPPTSALLPTLSQSGAGQGASLKLALAFSGPGEQVQITLNPFETHATLMDALGLVLHLLGENGDDLQIGLLVPGELQAIFTASSSMQYLQRFANDYLALLQAVLSSSGSSAQNNLFQPAFTCASDLVALVTDTTERAQLADMLWRLLGKTIAPASINSTLATFGQAQFGLGMLGYLKDNALAVGRTLFQQNNPVVMLQSVSNATPTPTVAAPTPKVVTPTPTVTRTPRITPTPGSTRKP